jgi:TM2 domain-containing membrane protein YozV
MSKSKKSVNWTVIIWLSFFLGILGVDRFVMGKIWTGILKLITLGGLGIWYLIDLILIMSSYKFKNINWVFPKNKTIHIVIICILFLISFSVIYSDYLDTSSTKNDINLIQQQIQNKQEISIVSYSFNDFSILCNPSATDLQKKNVFDKNFKDQYVEWTGIVSSISESFGSYTLQVKHCPNTFISDNTIIMKKDQKDNLLKYKEGQRITYRAKLTRLGDILGLSSNEGIIIE